MGESRGVLLNLLYYKVNFLYSVEGRKDVRKGFQASLK